MILNNSSRGLLKENDKVLFIEYKINDEVFYSLPGGTVEVGESLEECVIREFGEETGLNIEVGDLILLNEFISPQPNSKSERWKNGIHQIESIFLVERNSNENIKTIPNYDIGMQGLVWLDIHKLQEVKYYPEKPVEWFYNRNTESKDLYLTKKYGS